MLLLSRYSWVLHGILMALMLFSIASYKGERDSIPLPNIQAPGWADQEIPPAPGAAADVQELLTVPKPSSVEEKIHVPTLDI